MKALIKSQAKLNRVSSSDLTNKVEVKLINSAIGFDYKFYQKLFVILLSSFTFLIFPESPQDSHVLCEKYHSKEACTAW